MSSYITAGANKLRKAREWATPTLKESAFLVRGVLTPEEFVKAGDELVYKCPTWSWESGDRKKIKNYLPADKQYLVTRNVPCPTRASTMENSVALNDEDTAQAGEECGGDDWLLSRIISPEEQQRRIDEKLEEEFDILDEEGETVQSNDDVVDELAKVKIGEEEKDNAEEDDADEYADMEEFEDDNVIEDEAATTNTESRPDKFNGDDNLVKVRTYDLSLTYDKYYQTPRVWMMGYASSDSSQPLTGPEVMQDVMTDYANRTVTIDPHPHVAGPHASIHPCQHGAVMKTIVKNLTKAASGEEGEAPAKSPSVEMYLFIFLKFVSSIIPTINYDFTMEVTVSTKK
eukprot:CAMPEP_0198260296 /NCGR_PEP_ID=MMETSP1447-20131203/9303_1 /TAXON_ID=420782 /ORGANISM="Chaetoceros dichaeta, Strain CCMP1751" /LENGTH=343 /DNA_ID=CAMNT_0043947927 /DNA_START=239 /DNA_END=1270 /DNA_ORIENTATION=-